MREQSYIIEKQDSFELKDIFECGQCFRWNIEEDESYTGVIKNAIINVKRENEKIIFTGKCEENIEEIVRYYFDLDTNYNDLKIKLSNIDEYLKTSIEYGKGIRILKQDPWEALISFIIKQ